MSEITSRVEIARPPDQVFAYVTDPAHFGEWQDDVVDVRGETPSGTGSRFTTTRRVGRRKFAMTQEVVESAPPTTWSARGVDGPVRPNVKLAIEPLDEGNRSRLTAVMDFEGHGLGRLLVPLIVRRRAARQAPQSYRRLRELLERG
jgi:uncharacterized protein YndB with AHSA1/START domain